MTAADVAYVEANYLSFEEACAGRAEALEQVRAVAAAGQPPQPSYVLPDGTEMVPADYFEIADAGRDVFEREFSPPAAVPTRSTPSNGYLSGPTAPVSRSRHRRTSSGRRLSSRRSAGSSPRRSRAIAAGAPASGRQSTSSTSWSGRSRRTTTGPAGARARDRCITAPRERFSEVFAPVAAGSPSASSSDRAASEPNQEPVGCGTCVLQWRRSRRCAFRSSRDFRQPRPRP